MPDQPKRPTLSLKGGVKPKLPDAPPPPRAQWKCKPCGAIIPLSGEEDPAAEVRCPTCNARLGVAGDFNCEPPRTEKVRARLKLLPPDPPSPSERERRPTVVVSRRSGTRPR